MTPKFSRGKKIPKMAFEKKIENSKSKIGGLPGLNLKIEEATHPTMQRC
jgi:hypothetical protein